MENETKSNDINNENKGNIKSNDDNISSILDNESKNNANNDSNNDINGDKINDARNIANNESNTNKRTLNEINADVSEPPMKKIKLDNDTNNDSKIVNNNENNDIHSEHVSEIKQNPSSFSDKKSDNNNISGILQRSPHELRQFFEMMDEKTLREMTSELCKDYDFVFNDLRKRMNTNTKLCKIFIRSLNYETKSEQLDAIFKKYGTVNEAVIIKDKNTGKSRVYA